MLAIVPLEALPAVVLYRSQLRNENDLQDIGDDHEGHMVCNTVCLGIEQYGFRRREAHNRRMEQWNNTQLLREHSGPKQNVMALSH